jgi:hypothetical protein
MLSATNRDAKHCDEDTRDPLLVLLPPPPEDEVELDEDVGMGVAMGVVGL